MIVWEDYRNGNGDIYHQRYNSSGTALGSNTRVNDDSDSSEQSYPSIAMDVGGNFVIVWMDYRNGNRDIYHQRYRSIGAAQGINTKTNDDTGTVDQYFPSIAMNDFGNFVIAWKDLRNGNYDIYYQRYNSNGIAQGLNTKVNDDNEMQWQANPSVAMDGEGDIIIVWEDYRNGNPDIYYQRYNSNGLVQGNNAKVNDDAVMALQYSSSVAMNGVGSFVIVWVDDRNGNSDIYFQRYNNNGATQGVNIKATDDSEMVGQANPSVAINEAGNFVIAWEDYRYAGMYPDIMGQRYYTNGNLNGINYRIVADGPNYIESSPAVTANNDSIIFSWADNRRSMGLDVYGKIVDWNWNGVTSISEDGNNKPTDYVLEQNYPNPFNPSTKISWQSPVSSWQTLKVYDVLGNEVATLVDEYKPAGTYEVEFNSSSGIRNLVSGIYFYQLKVGNYSSTKKMLLLK